MAAIPHLIVDEFGAFLGKHSNRLRVSKAGETLVEAPLLHLEQVLVTGEGIALSADALRACAVVGIPIHFVDARGRPYGALYAAGLTGTVQTRREQLLAYHDERSVALAVAFAQGKITNQAGFLRYAAKYRAQTDPKLHRTLRAHADAVLDHLEALVAVQGQRADEVREQVLNSEGRAAQRYWEAVGLLLPAACQWPGRKGRGARDPVNAALNYGYGILYGQVERAIVLAGLDPYGGFIHADRPGKPSLVFDLIEEFRTVVVDRTVMGMVNRGVALELDERHRLTETSRRAVAEAVLERLEADERYEGKRQPLRTILQSQARHIATFVRGVRDTYLPFVARW